jgi:hypothetical protein
MEPLLVLSSRGACSSEASPPLDWKKMCPIPSEYFFLYETVILRGIRVKDKILHPKRCSFCYSLCLSIIVHDPLHSLLDVCRKVIQRYIMLMVYRNGNE